MSKFKVGDRVQNNCGEQGVIIDIASEYYKRPYVVQLDSGRRTSYKELINLSRAEPPLQIVYAVCDDSNGLLPVRVFMFEDNAREYALLNSPQGYSIRPFALTPINE